MEGVFSIIGNEVKPQHSVADPDLELKKGGGGVFVACPAGFSSFCDSFFFLSPK